MVQNTLARVVAQKSRYCLSTLVLAGLHWLPVRQIINFKIDYLVTYPILPFFYHLYLAQIIPIYTPSRSVRSSSSITIISEYLHHWGKHQLPLQNLFHPLYEISCPPMFLLPWHCQFSEGISSTIFPLRPTLVSLRCANHQNWNPLQYNAVHLTRSNPAPTISSFLTLVFLLGAGYLLAHEQMLRYLFTCILT